MKLNNESGDINLRKEGSVLMSERDENDARISLKDLLYSVVKKAGIILLAGIVLGGALFSYKVIQRVKTNDVLDATTRLSESETDVQYQLRVQNIERARDINDAIYRVNDQLNHLRIYLSDSIYMQIDAENESQATAQIVLSLENNDMNGLDTALFSAYEREIKSGNYLNDYAARLGTKPDYIKELITFTYAPANSTIISMDKDVNRAGSMYISVLGPDREFTNETMNLVIAEVQRLYSELNTSVAPHGIAVVGVQEIVKIDSTTRDGQANQTGRLETLQKQIVSYNDSLDKIAAELGLENKQEILSYFETHPRITVETDEIPTQTSERDISRFTMLKPGIKWGAIGFVAGVFLLAFVFVLQYIFGKKIASQAQFFSLFPYIRKIGVMKPAGKRSKFVSSIDVKSDDDSKMSKENTLKLISANYSNITKDCNKVLITGVGDSKVMGEAVKSLGIKGDYKPNMFNDPDVLKSVPDYDGIVLIEQRKVSAIKDIKNEIELISNGGTEIIGAIII